MNASTGGKRLIVNADDYGYTSGVSAGIRLAHQQGIVSSTTVMMTMPAAVEELGRLRSDTPSLGVGIHLTVTAGRPYRLPRTLDAKRLAVELADLPVGDLRAEWRAQADTFLATGLALTHFDSHHHAAYRHPNALRVLLDLAREYGVPVRAPYPIGDAEADVLADDLAASGIRHPDHFVDVFDQTLSVHTLVGAIEALGKGVTEFMFHPGLVDEELRRVGPSYAEPRAAELSALCDPAVRSALSRGGIDLVTFAALAAD